MLALSAACAQQNAPEVRPAAQLPGIAPDGTSCLTGNPIVNEKAGIQPVAVAIDNVRAALPQRGLSNASVIYEAVYSGGITHLLAVFDNYDIMPETGPVTVMDTQLMQLAIPLGAMCVAASATDEAQALIDKYDYSKLCLNGSFETGALSLDSDRNAVTDISRCWFTSGTLFSMAAKRYSLVPETTSRNYAFNFADTARTLANDARKISVKFSGYTTAQFSYSDVYKKYQKLQFNEKQIDENTSMPLYFSNVIILFGNIIENGAEKNEFDFTSGGDGYYFNGGKYEKITFSKTDEDAPLLFENADGTAFINRGTTYIALVNKDDFGHFEIKA